VWIYRYRYFLLWRCARFNEM
jgi:hypothetical protein